MNKFAFFLVLVVLFARPLRVQAQQNIPAIHLRGQILLLSPNVGSVNVSNYEKWPFQLLNAGNITITAVRTSGDLALLPILFDANGSELAHTDSVDSAKLSESRPAGNYFVQFQRRTGSGTYSLSMNPASTLPTGTLAPTLSPGSFMRLIPRSTPIFSLTPSATPGPTVTPSPTSGLTATPSATPAASLTLAATLTPIVAQNLSNRSDPTYTPTPASSPSVMPSTTPMITAVNTAGASTSEVQINNLSSRANLDSGLTPTNVSATLIDASRQVIFSTSLNADGTYLLKAPFGTFTLQLRAPGFLTAQKLISLTAGQPFQLAETTLLAGDVNGDNEINALDLISLGAAYEITPLQLPSTDLNGDGHVDLFDLTLLAKNWRRIGPTGW